MRRAFSMLWLFMAETELQSTPSSTSARVGGHCGYDNMFLLSRFYNYDALALAGLLSGTWETLSAWRHLEIYREYEVAV
jgi:hypothetical protein